jgi:hypothetical protein
MFSAIANESAHNKSSKSLATGKPGVPTAVVNLLMLWYPNVVLITPVIARYLHICLFFSGSHCLNGTSIVSSQLPSVTSKATVPAWCPHSCLLSLAKLLYQCPRSCLLSLAKLQYQHGVLAVVFCH